MFDMGRLLRFASKGFFGTLLWAEWYDLSDVLIQEETIVSAFQSMGMVLPNNDWSIPLARTVALILAEQFITCPLIYGIWEIPVSTVLNGASPSKIPKEVKSKMIPMLVDNAKLWTWANLIIYNVPLSYRAICGNVMDILWQSIVSDYAADCGRDEERVETDVLESNVNMDYDSNNDHDVLGGSDEEGISSRVLFPSMIFKK
jgi:protein Mpv17